jgi:hypothetical protein
MTTPITPQRGDFVRVRTRRWLAENQRSGGGLTAFRLACVEDAARVRELKARPRQEPHIRDSI